MALISPVDLVPAEALGAVHFIAIGGAGMSGVASLFHQRGLAVSGCDQSDSATLRQLAAEGIEVHLGHDVAHLAGVGTVVRSSAVRASNPELVRARELGLRVWHRSAALGSLMLGHRGIAVTGTHGKTTTTAMTSVMLSHAGADPSYVVGAPLAATGSSAHLGAGEVFVVEADESDGSFLQYPAEIVVITNIEADHLDNWHDPEGYAAGFARFASQPGVRQAVINADDDQARALAAVLRDAGEPQVLSYGSHPDADLRLIDCSYRGSTSSAKLYTPVGLVELSLQVPGLHNLTNAAAAFGCGLLLGLDPEDLLAGIAEFTGTLRRFQPIGSAAGVRVYDDYAHHPTEIRAALSAARRVAGEGRVIACFQPHLFTRTRDFADQFGAALTLADVVVVTDVYGAREDPLPGVTGALVAEAVQAHGGTVHYVADKAELPGALSELVTGGDLVMTLGAGDVTLVGPLLIRRLQEQ